MKIAQMLLALLFAAQLHAQYTYISDRRFFEPDDLVGYDFKPGMMEVPQEEAQTEIDAGEYSFGVTYSNLYVKGGKIQGVYNINNIAPEEYGFKLALMNARDARLQGHLKVVVNKNHMVESLIFKRSPNEKETIFYLLPIPTKVKEQETNWFTDRGELVIEHKDSLWGRHFRPFLRVHTGSKVQERLRQKDSTSVRFLEVVTIEEKDSKKKKQKEETVAATPATPPPPTPEGESDMPPASTDTIGTADGKKVKIIKEYFVIVRSILTYEDGTKEDKTWQYPVKKIVEREDEKAGLQEEKFQWEFVTDKGD
ncbi:MAG: hypothetical protein AAB316_07875, partial [Bacteroidota bacterium]